MEEWGRERERERERVSEKVRERVRERERERGGRSEKWERGKNERVARLWDLIMHRTNKKFKNNSSYSQVFGLRPQQKISNLEEFWNSKNHSGHLCYHFWHNIHKNMSKMLSSFNIRLNQIIFYINSKKINILIKQFSKIYSALILNFFNILQKF